MRIFTLVTYYFVVHTSAIPADSESEDGPDLNEVSLSDSDIDPNFGEFLNETFGDELDKDTFDNLGRHILNSNS